MKDLKTFTEEQVNWINDSAKYMTEEALELLVTLETKKGNHTAAAMNKEALRRRIENLKNEGELPTFVLGDRVLDDRGDEFAVQFIDGDAITVLRTDINGKRIFRCLDRRDIRFA